MTPFKCQFLHVLNVCKHLLVKNIRSDGSPAYDLIDGLQRRKSITRKGGMKLNSSGRCPNRLCKRREARSACNRHRILYLFVFTHNPRLLMEAGRIWNY